MYAMGLLALPIFSGDEVLSDDSSVNFFCRMCLHFYTHVCFLTEMTEMTTNTTSCTNFTEWKPLVFLLASQLDVSILSYSDDSQQSCSLAEKFLANNPRM